MARVTSKLQVTIPKAVAERYGIVPGAEIDWLPAGEAIRVVPRTGAQRPADLPRRLQLFDRATERHRARELTVSDAGHIEPPDRGWTREELYERGGAR